MQDAAGAPGSLMGRPAGLSGAASLKPADSQLLPGAPPSQQQQLNKGRAGHTTKKRERQDKLVLQDKIVQESPSFCALLEQQQRVDDLVSRRKASIREALGRPDRVRQRLRLTVTHTCHPAGPNQPLAWTLILHGRVLDQATDLQQQQQLAQLASQGSAGVLADNAVARLLAGVGPSGSLGATGLPGAAGGGAAGTQQQQAATAAATAGAAKHPFTHYVRRVEVRLYPPAVASTGPAAVTEDAPMTDAAGQSEQQGEGQRQGGGEPGPEAAAPLQVLVWDRSLHLGAHKDSLELRASGVGPLAAGARAHITVLWNALPERYALPAPLDAVLGVAVETQARISLMVQNYVRQHRLVDAQQVVQLKGRLAEAFGGQASIPLQQLLDEVQQRLVPLPPLTVEHTLSVPGPGQVAQRPRGHRAGGLQLRSAPGAPPVEVFDVECDALGPLNPAVERQAHALLDALNPERELDALDVEINAALRRLAEHRRRRTVLLGLAQSPVEFTAGVLSTQARELRVVKGNSTITQVVNSVTQQINVKLAASQYEQFINPALNLGAKEFEAVRKSELFKQRWVEDACIAYLSQRQVAASNAPGAALGASAPPGPSMA